ncbi:hypothetical protein EVG20_g1319 [Dentipellis fragilis]|uniref:Folate-sensitive fragile site protein Fra10Ac1 n=1 Tax=Dentipellis fragilis TaxID=205917 RepID=A0A4Y9ZCU9_9AGAM|nr:hypothetical protein EVG20_g1319 [Dentipellis fragilis]
MALYGNSHASSSRTSATPASLATEFDILKSTHKFLREEGEEENSASWNEKLAQKYYSSLFREFAVCDLKHYKSGNFSLRWRTESEVLSGAGETTCGNTRCPHHAPGDDPDAPPEVPLQTLELPFAYEEHGEVKNALVKVVLCDRCCKKLMWKRNKEKESQAKSASGSRDERRKGSEGHPSVGGERDGEHADSRDAVEDGRRKRHKEKRGDDVRAEFRRGGRSRSRSPRRKRPEEEYRHSRRPRSPS